MIRSARAAPCPPCRYFGKKARTFFVCETHLSNLTWSVTTGHYVIRVGDCGLHLNIGAAHRKESSLVLVVIVFRMSF